MLDWFCPFFALQGYRIELIASCFRGRTNLVWALADSDKDMG
jgi:hypothetical protein